MSTTRMLINYVPGEECRVALVEDGRLEELHAETTAAANRVGNIYLGVVANVESAIQAAFVDFGVKQHGFLHVTDLHPQYFPGEDAETTERVGHKTPRRERPLIQKCLKKGQQILVQVLKEGAGTKGPSLTSYLSIPGRHIVMMPKMDRVGVSRRVEDEETRKRMREVLDQLDLPEGFGFIIRTAGLDKTKAELKRDLAYLQRLWKDMETRRKTGKGPRLLYTESDLLVRALRDLTSTGFDEIVVDNELALARAAKFRKIVAPRSQTVLLHYKGHTPIFHAYGIEEQITNIHSREVPLPSGGRLVIDQTEALVAVDVNSGKSRSARDAETNAYKTNLEAVDEICRQLKLRDLGGVVINDLIDMRDSRHRREIEARFRDRLKRDRAKSTILPISNFGILEMTRQRIRSSHETIHFTSCSTCRGRGLVQRPDSVAADALRSLAALLDQPKVHRVELVVSPMVASDMLSNRRRHINRLEQIAGKHVDVRVSETLAADRTSFYAYDENGTDIDIQSLPKTPKKVNAEPWTGDPTGQWAIDLQDEFPDADEDIGDFESEDESATRSKKKRRRRGRRGKKSADSSTSDAESAATDGTVVVDSQSPTDPGDPDARKADPGKTSAGDAQGRDRETAASEAPSQDAAEGDAKPGKSKRRRRGRRKKKSGTPSADGVSASDPADSASASPPTDAETVESQDPDSTERRTDQATAQGDDEKPTRSKRRRRGRRRKKTGSVDTAGSQSVQSDGSTAPDTGSNSQRATESGGASSKASAHRAHTRMKAAQSTEISDAADGAPAQGASAQDDHAPPPKKKSKSRRRKKTSRTSGAAEVAPEPVAETSDSASGSTSDTPPTKKRRTRSKRTAKKSADKANAANTSADTPAEKPVEKSTDKPKPPRTLYASRRRLSASERARLGHEE